MAIDLFIQWERKSGCTFQINERMVFMSNGFRSKEELMRYINNPHNYHVAKKKQYDIWCCIPKLGTQVYNRLEHATYVTSPEKNNFVVLSGTVGEQWVISFEKLLKTYTPSSEETILSVLHREFGLQGGTPYAQRIQACAVQYGATADWFKVHPRTDSTCYWACFVPSQYQFAINTAWGSVLLGNRIGIPHGWGDFVVCSEVNGSPNLNDRWVVNGAVFATTYNNRGWKGCIDPSLINQSAKAVPKPRGIVMPRR